MASHWWTIFISALTIGISDVKAETTAYPEIPKHLLECYKNDGIYHPANRAPNSLESFLDLIQKVEDGPTGRNINARELSLVLLHYLKLDGIQSLQSHTRISSNIIPFAPSGDEYFKHRLTLIGLVPKIDQSYLSALNESLTQKELCNLHFMLSYSIDPYKRDNERCSPLYEDIKFQSQGESRSDWNPYLGEPYDYLNTRRIRRHFLNKDGRLCLEKTSHKKKENPRQERTKRMADDKNRDVEVFSLRQVKKPASSEPEIARKEKFMVRSQTLLSPREIRAQGLQSLSYGRPIGYGGMRPTNSRTGFGSDDGSPYSGILPGMQLSECPSVNGIITTPFGSLAIGTVIAGIAAGLNPEEIHPIQLSVNPSELANQMDRVNNIWATTLAGTVADTISSSALLEMENLQILRGGWNESFSPRWYLLKNNQFKHPTEVLLRGSLDGLFLGLNAKELMNKYSNLKLSHLLQVYYEHSWGEVGAKNRVKMRPQYATDETFKKQVHLMSLVLKRQKTNVITVLNFDLIVRDAVSRVSSYIQNMDQTIQNGPGSPTSTNLDVEVNLVAVIDSNWGYESLIRLFEALRKAKVAATPYQSNLTIICGYDGHILMHAENSLDLNSRFTEESFYRNCTRGLNFLAVFDSLEYFYRKLYQEEETSNKINGNSQVLVFFPFDTFASDNHEITALRSKEFQQIFPDVRLIIAANGRSEAFEGFVKSQKDIFTIVSPSVDPNSKTLKDLVDGIKQSFQRISRPSCGSYFDDDSKGAVNRMVKELFPGDIVYFRILPQYFFASREDVIVTIRSKQRAPLTVCHSREVERPEDFRVKTNGHRQPNDDRNRNYNYNYNSDYSFAKQTDYADGPVQCKTITSETYTIEVNYPCYSAYTLDECQPLYISLRPQEQAISITCPSCRMPYNVQSEISVTGLTCYNSAGSFVFHPSTFLFFVFFAYFYNLTYF